MRFAVRRVSTSDGFPISQPQNQRQPRFPPPPSQLQKPALRRLHKFRTIVLPILLAMVFTTLILGAIYAYCVAKPHTDIADQLAIDSNAEVDSSLFGRRRSLLTSRETTSTTNSSSLNGSSLSQEEEREDRESEVALMFYTLTTPIVSLVHLSFELIMHHHTPQHLSLRSIYATFLVSSSLLAAGWLTTLSFWMHCEIPPLNKSGQSVCPVQVRGHFMYGIHEVSVAKAVVGWIVFLLYAGHLVLLTMGFRAQRRVWKVSGADARDVELPQNPAREVIRVGIDGALSKELAGK
ncbi:uncharacterized protein Z518_05592 [Rhinocladiella mackenziei CBS 650.93]|uniref:Rhinocladiella mackenziei CBS 650.93 unplaced genomic scaffold supercont1.4, whole genome shotgun sequence n=1 Tax=Rhinocladiella mackenziei CBS 650.93 TaxID=1442369 RepID=A0A0D2FR92_9EURO|nr:uncharacterized protein Z518_05592 [Rhinocladiella mackenziei CBS 650.93]KIX04722.1 hypothetical protein Z518_05592 [Rhinocladiella mackenziei CBS 650.93]